MKRIVLLFPLLGLLLFSSCEKEGFSNFDSMPEGQIIDKSIVIGNYQVEQRAYEWVGEKLDCSKEGSGCVVGSRGLSDGGDNNLSVNQVLFLMNLNSSSLSEQIINSDLSELFPLLYEPIYFDGINQGIYSTIFEFPYLKIIDDQENLILVYNYESYLSNSIVYSRVMNNGEYTKKIQLNTNPNIPAVWICEEEGNNCKVTSFAMNASWLEANPDYLNIPSTSHVSSISTFDQGEIDLMVIELSSGDKYGVKF